MVRVACVFMLLVGFSCATPAKLVTYVDRLIKWWPPEDIMAGIGVPEYAPQNPYNVMNLAFWTTSGPVDIALVWTDPGKYFGDDFMQKFSGSTNPTVFRQALRKSFNDANIKIMVSAFGATDFPTSAGKDPVKVATDLGNFIKENQLDGVDIDWEDNGAMNAGTGEEWLITFMKTLRQILPVGKYLVSHAPQAPYFDGLYKNGAYLKVDQEVGNLIDWYNVQFYNQGSTQYDTYECLFTKADGWATTSSVAEIMAKGIERTKIVVGKPVTTGDASNTGFVSADKLNQFFERANTDLNWNTGLMTWQYPSDMEGQFRFSETVAQSLGKQTSLKESL